ncbi:NAD-dependent epimerase/dehydratase family protein [Sporolactobacillus spathodeae]|uniref:Nucleoside-diphosphate-sugar epimerase n=1 Tax=Sporolactobacillus spathodeae TaxID=1465502 RepID=A0ABS2Q9E3_9BACL|nr:NAD(P)-dependent oxidoreductase [Sporolactobacillus spathodeae]MBM7658399.1 nucleoside-diphosphate-sugar epimerase [Sporolactobacillus spathodeae]
MKKKVFITGASGGMGQQSLKQMIKDRNLYDITILSFDSPKDRAALQPYTAYKEVTIYYGDLLDYELVKKCVKNADLILHIAAFVSPAADYYPKKAMEINYGSARNIVHAIFELGQEERTKLVNIGTIAETGDRMPPIHWGRVGDPIKTSMYDYYAVSKVAAERLVIESGLKYWVSLRQTGIMGPAMSKIVDAIMFHNCLDNVLEYVSDRDSGRLMGNLCQYEFTGKLPGGFWNHIYNIGGGESCRVSTYEMYQVLYGAIGFKNLDHAINPKWYATRNFHGQYYLDSDKLDDYLHFRHDGMDYFYKCYLENLGGQATLAKILCKLPGGQKLMGTIMKKMFLKQARSAHGTVHFIEDNVADHIDAYWGSKEKWEKIPKKLSDFEHFTDWNKKVVLDHGYDETKAPEWLSINDVKGAAKFRGGECLSTSLETGNWQQKLEFRCAFGHTFEASPKLVLEGGHWCPECERESWNYSERAKVDSFFAQVWNPLHDANETRVYKKVVSERDV